VGFGLVFRIFNAAQGSTPVTEDMLSAVSAAAEMAGPTSWQPPDWRTAR
jgi:hypothetical protein